jgi:hypothetical protein
LVLSCLGVVLSWCCLVLWLSCPVLSCLVLSCLVLSCPVLSCLGGYLGGCLLVLSCRVCCACVGAKVVQFAGDATELALECTVEVVDQTLSLGDFLQAQPLREGPLSMKDPVTFVWRPRWVSLSAVGVLIFKDQEAMLAKTKENLPKMMIPADDILSVEKEGGEELTVRTRDHVIHRCRVGNNRDAWFESIRTVQHNSRRFIALSTNRNHAAAESSTSMSPAALTPV